MKYSKLLLILFLSFHLHLTATDEKKEVSISGFVKDAASGEAMIGTNILLYRESLDNTPPYRGVASNRYGYYSFPDVDKGRYIVVFSNIGYNQLVDTLLVSISSGSLKYDAFLDKTDIRMEEVIVSGERKSKAIVSEIKLSQSMLKALPTMSGEVDIFKSLQLLPGVQIASELSSGLYIRGGSPDQTLTIVDNMIVYNPTHLGNFASTFNSNAVQDIILVKGAFPAEYGGRLSSVLDIKLRSGTKEKEKLIIGLGSLNSNLTLEGPLNENATYIIAGRTMYYDLLQKSLFKDSENPYYNFHDLNTKFTYNLSDKDAVSISSYYSKDRLYSPDNTEDLEYEMSWLNGAASVSWLRSSDKYISNTVASYVEYHFNSMIDNNLNSIEASDYFASSKLRDFSFSNDIEVYMHKNHKIKTGLQIMIHSYNLVASDVYHYSLEQDSDLRTRLNSLEASGYILAESQLTERLKTNIGGRLYYFKSNKQLSFEPRLSFMYNITDYLAFKGALAISHQYLHLMFRNNISLPTDFWFPSTEQISPSKSTQYVAGFESNFGGNEYIISLEAYYRDMKNIYEFKDNAKFRPSTPIYDLITKGQGEAYGIESFINKRIGKLTGWIGYTYSYTKRLFDELNLSRIYYPRYDRRHDISIVLCYDIADNFFVSATWNYATGQGVTMPYAQYQAPKTGSFDDYEILLLYTERNGHRLPAYHKLDISCSYDFTMGKSDMTFFISLFNVYDRKNIFAQYLTFKEIIDNESGEINYLPQIKQIVLFPFIPTFGIKFNL